MAMTCVFEMNAEDFRGNPFKAETQFGCPLIVSKGNVCDEAALLRAEMDHWLQFVSAADMVQFPFKPNG